MAFATGSTGTGVFGAGVSRFAGFSGVSAAALRLELRPTLMATCFRSVGTTSHTESMDASSTSLNATAAQPRDGVLPSSTTIDGTTVDPLSQNQRLL